MQILYPTILHTQYNATDANTLFWSIAPQRTMVQLNQPENADNTGTKKFIEDLMRARTDCYGEGDNGILFKQGRIEQGRMVPNASEGLLISFDIEAIASPLKTICENVHLLQRIEILQTECAQHQRPNAFQYTN